MSLHGTKVICVFSKKKGNLCVRDVLGKDALQSVCQHFNNDLEDHIAQGNGSIINLYLLWYLFTLGDERVSTICAVHFLEHMVKIQC